MAHLPKEQEKKKFIEAIGNPPKLRILLVLWKSNKELTVYKICQRTGLGRSAVARHLNNLVESQLVSRRIYGEIPLYKLKKDYFRVTALAEFFIRSKL